jgi:maltose/moltooligosaccharide transporter
MFNKPKLSFLADLEYECFRNQYSFGLQQSAVNPIYDFLGASQIKFHY